MIKYRGIIQLSCPKQIYFRIQRRGREEGRKRREEGREEERREGGREEGGRKG